MFTESVLNEYTVKKNYKCSIIILTNNILVSYVIVAISGMRTSQLIKDRS